MATEQNGNDDEFQQLEPQPILSIRATVLIEELAEAMGDRIQALRGYLQQHGLQPAGPPFVRYHTFEETETDIETGVPVFESVAGEGRITNGELPGGPAITTWHTGPHNKLGEAYARIADGLKEQGREPNGASWEVYYWIDLSQGFDPSGGGPSTGRTQLVQPVK
jgi:effector-binding domain-containing protein